jgi:8-oxo-dGTP pyrophosphatase MutT (NUDIX family)
MVKRRYSFKFGELMRFSKMTPDMFNHMPLSEKMLLLTLDFDMCERLYNTPFNPSTNDYVRRKDKFNSKILCDGGKKLISFINKSTYHPAEIWEIPKGRLKNKTFETDFECAVREFCEETNISRDHVKVIPNIKFAYCFTEDKVNYEYIYYLAYYINGKPPNGVMFFNRSQTNEVIDMQWFSSEEIHVLSNPVINCNSELSNFVKKVLKISKKHKKTLTKVNLIKSI